MKEAIEALSRLCEEQGKQIVELSKALAIAHEHHNQPQAVVVPPAPALDADRLWMTEEEEDAQFSDDPNEVKKTELYFDILKEVGLDPNISVAQAT